MPGKWSIHFAKLDEQDVEQVEAQWVYLDDDARLMGEAKKVHIHNGNYLLLLVPMFLDDQQSDESEVVRRAEWARGLLTSVFGHTAMQTNVFNQRYSTKNSDVVEFASPILQTNLQPSEWYVFGAESFDALGPAIGSEIDRDLRRRIETALQFIGRAASDIDPVIRFSHIWIALEIVAGGHAAAKNFLNSLPNFRGEAKKLIDMRNALFHHGVRSHQIQLEEKLLTACVLAMIFQNFGIADPAFDDFVSSYVAAKASV